MTSPNGILVAEEDKSDNHPLSHVCIGEVL
jgi:hypothetical protein